jgi:hypothetical protein
MYHPAAESGQLVEDLHMPLHVGENPDNGGHFLQVRWFDRGSNLHRV